MKSKIFLPLLFIFVHSAFAQMGKFPNGVYFNLEQLKNLSPAYDVQLETIHRTSGDIFMNGGNDYKFESTIDSLDKKYIRKNIFAYVKNDSIFLNCIHHKLQTWYALALTSGNFLAFNACMTNSDATTTAIFAGAIGAGLSAKKRYLNVLSLRTGNVRELTKAYMTERLKENQDILTQYNNEKEPESEATLIKYVNLLNQTTTPNAVPSK